MGTIQQSVNNALVTGTALASLNPGLQQKAKDRTELKKLDSQKQLIEKRFENVMKEFHKNPTNTAIKDEADVLIDKISDNISQRYDIDPSEENADDYFNMLTQRIEYNNQQKAKEAQIASERQAALRKKQKEEFTRNRLNRMNTSLGVKVGDLPENIRRQVEAAYNNNGGNK